jgi:hypothetical protein
MDVSMAAVVQCWDFERDALDEKNRSPLASRHVKMHARLLLQIADYAEKVLCLRVAARTKHTDQALRRRASCCPELFKADGRLDVVA